MHWITKTGDFFYYLNGLTVYLKASSTISYNWLQLGIVLIAYLICCEKNCPFKKKHASKADVIHNIVHCSFFPAADNHLLRFQWCECTNALAKQRNNALMN